MDLNAPLGFEPPPPPRNHRLVPLILGVAAIALIGLGAYLLVGADPRGGEPYAVALIPPAPAPKPAPTSPANVTPANVTPANVTDPMPTGSTAPPPTPAPQADAVRMENGVKVVSPSLSEPSAGRQPGPLVIDVTKALDGGPRKVSALDRTRRPGAGSTMATDGGARPRVAIFVGGLGLSAAQTRTAIEMMPAAVSLAFVPTGTAIASDVQTAKAKGHEILLQLPMQSAKGTSVGPHTLRTGETSGEMAADLTWLMGQVDGYAGVTNLLGAPVTANQSAMTAILRTVGSRGVFYLDDGTSKRSLALSLGHTLSVPTLQADVVLDATGDPTVVQANLERLVAIARAKGFAIGTASGLSDHLATVARFADALDGKGLSLVPVGAIARGGTSLATTR